MKTLEVSVSQARRANEIIYDCHMIRKEMKQTSSNTWEFSREVEFEEEILEENIINALEEGGVSEFEIN